MPDIFIARDTTGINSYYNSVVNRRLDEYAMLCSDTNKEKLSALIVARCILTCDSSLLLNLVSSRTITGLEEDPTTYKNQASCWII